MTERLPADPGVPGEAHEMARSYSVGELLTMRDTLPLLICNISKLNPKIDSGLNYRLLLTLESNNTTRYYQSPRGCASRPKAQFTLKHQSEFHDKKEHFSLF